MKKGTKMLILIAFIIVAGASFMVGSYMKEQEHLVRRQNRCKTLITFAIDKVENRDLSEDGVLEALISNIYGAHEFCDDPELASQLNDLWNSLIYKPENYIGKEDDLSAQLQSIAGRIGMKE